MDMVRHGLFAAVLLVVLAGLAETSRAQSTTPSTEADEAAQEYVVAAPPTFLLADRPPLEGLILRTSPEAIWVRSASGPVVNVDRDDLQGIEFSLVSGETLRGELHSWREDGSYEITVEDALVRVYSSVAPAERSRPGAPTDTQLATRSVFPPNPTPPRPVQDGADDEVAPTPLTPVVANLDPVAVEVSATSARESEPALIFDVVLSEVSPSPVVLIYATVDMTAISGRDYEAQRGVLTVPTGND